MSRRVRSIPERSVFRWERGRCEFWITPRAMCGKKGRWFVDGQIRCGEHKLR